MRLVAGLVGIMIVLALVVPVTAVAGPRIQWETKTPSIHFRHVSESVYFGDTTGTPRTLLQASLSGRLLSLAPADTALYAVFFRNRDELSKLTRLLNDIGTPTEWNASPHCPLDRGRASYERIRMDGNGRLVIQADEARHPASNFLAVVNSAGEILGSRPVWTAPRESGAMANNETAATR